MVYKALFLDVDGTLIPYDYNALPSQKIADSIKKAAETTHICLVTGRSYGSITHILDRFNLENGFAITNGGSVVLDLKTKRILYDKPIDPKDTKDIVNLLRKDSISFYAKQHPLNDVFEGKYIQPNETIFKSYMFFVDELYSHDKVVELFNKLSKYPNLTLHKTRHKDPEKFGFNITHAEATKLHGIEIVMKEYGLKREEIIGVGDGYNDFPLLMASGLKVAMGNAIDELKEIADYVAPNVTEDGVADVIEKFILKP